MALLSSYAATRNFNLSGPNKNVRLARELAERVRAVVKYSMGANAAADIQTGAYVSVDAPA
jgi:hypothetical protein